jgi:hypothetical protein
MSHSLPHAFPEKIVYQTKGRNLSPVFGFIAEKAQISFNFHLDYYFFFYETSWKLLLV